MKTYENTRDTSQLLGAADCSAYVEDMAVCDDTGEPKGQCLNCGGKWHEHRLEVLKHARQRVCNNANVEGGSV